MVVQLMQYQISFIGLSNTGLVRKNNEDHWAYINSARLFVLADGMGGHRGGEVASHEAIDYLEVFFKQFYEKSDKSLTGIAKALQESICEMNRIIYRMSRQFSDLHGMGTTLCTLHIHRDGIVYGHVGDSRIYRLRDAKLERLTQDHSLLRELIELGQLSEQQEESFAYKHVLTKAIGTEPSIVPCIKTDNLAIGDQILLCSDGLTDMLLDSEIETILLDPLDSANSLMAKALSRGGRDNITLVLISILANDATDDLS